MVPLIRSILLKRRRTLLLLMMLPDRQQPPHLVPEPRSRKQPRGESDQHGRNADAQPDRQGDDVARVETGAGAGAGAGADGGVAVAVATAAAGAAVS